MSNRKSTRRTQIAPIGKQFGKLIVIGYSHAEFRVNSKTPRWIDYWLCRCECGVEKPQLAFAVSIGKIRSCGCGRIEAVKRAVTTHGLSRVKCSGFSILAGMIQRCENPKDTGYAWYGAIGTKVCKRWHHFESFLEDVGGPPSPDYTIDRIDNNGHYSCGKCDECLSNGWPMNARWATRAEQARNRRTNVYIVHDGKRMVMEDWAKLAMPKPLNSATLRTRLAHGWSMERALSQAVE